MTERTRARIWERLARLDRRLIYLVLAVTLVVALLSGVKITERPSVLVEPLFARVDSLPPGSPVLVSFDYSPSSAPELEPMAYAVIRHALQRGHRLCFTSMWPVGNNQIGRVVDDVLAREFPDRLEGRHWVRLGFKSGGEMLINAMRQGLDSMYDTDVRGVPLAQLPALAGVEKLEDFSLIVSLSSGTPGLKEWILFAGDPIGVPVGGGCNGAGTTQFLPYFPRQLVGLMGGLKGAAEYESALAAAYPEFALRSAVATENMGPQTVAHTVIIVFVLIGNLGALLARRRGGGAS